MRGKMNLNSCYDWGMRTVKKMGLKWPWRSNNIKYGFIPRGVILLDDEDKVVVFNEDCMGVHYFIPSAAIFDYPESHHIK